jgi:hypothetical protein
MQHMHFLSVAAEIDRCISSGLLVGQEAILHKQALVKLLEGAASNAVLTVGYILIEQHQTRLGQTRPTQNRRPGNVVEYCHSSVF